MNIQDVIESVKDKKTNYKKNGSLKKWADISLQILEKQKPQGIISYSQLLVIAKRCDIDFKELKHFFKELKKTYIAGLTREEIRIRFPGVYSTMYPEKTQEQIKKEKEIREREQMEIHRKIYTPEKVFGFIAF